MKHFLLLFLLFTQASYAEMLTGRVVKVADGDTITILDVSNNQHRIRLAGIDAPERKQDFGKVSKKFLADQIAGKTVNVQWHKTDRYKRKIGKVIFNGIDINLKQVEYGLAWFYKKYERELEPTDRVLYSEAQSAAQASKSGIWVYVNPIAPWDYRKLRRERSKKKK